MDQEATAVAGLQKNQKGNTSLKLETGKSVVVEKS